MKFFKVTVFAFLFFGLGFVLAEMINKAVFMARFSLDGDEIIYKAVWLKPPFTKIPQGYQMEWTEKRLSARKDESEQGVMIEIPKDSLFMNLDVGELFFYELQKKRFAQIKTKIREGN